MRDAGAVPATVAVVDGCVRVGIGEAELERLAAAADVRKVSARDLAACVISGRLGATTVAGTLAVCRIAGIHFMATGGIGGVHRGWQDSRDVSADLREIAESAGLRRLLGHQVVSGRGRHAGGAGDARDPGDRLWHRQLPAVLPPRQRITG